MHDSPLRSKMKNKILKSVLKWPLYKDICTEKLET